MNFGQTREDPERVLLAVQLAVAQADVRRRRRQMRVLPELPPEVLRQQTQLRVIYRKSTKPADARLADLAEALAPSGRRPSHIFHIVLELDRALDLGAPSAARRVDGAVVLAVDLPVLCG